MKTSYGVLRFVISVHVFTFCFSLFSFFLEKYDEPTNQKELKQIQKAI